MKTYTTKRGTTISQNEKEIRLRRGVIHKNELTIDKEGSSDEFVQSFNELIDNKMVNISVEEPVYDDLETLTRFGFLTVSMDETKMPLIVVDDELIERVKPHFNAGMKIVSASTFLSSSELKVLIEDKDVVGKTQLIEEKKSALVDFSHIYLITSMERLLFLRGFNRLMKLLNKVNTMAFFDNQNVFITCIEHGETGCYECLEQQMLMHFDGMADTYMNNIESDVTIPELFLAVGFIQKEIANINIYGQSSLLGNVMHFNVDHYEYAFNTNRIQACCSTCATFNTILFEEQNIRSVNILKELMQHD